MRRLTLDQPTTIAGPGGRSLDVYVDGPKQGIPLLFHNGTPGTGQLFPPFVEAASDRGLKFISFSRAGYGSSTRDPRRTVANVAPDVAAILDALGERRFYTLGWSGGGPHALACAAILAERVIGAATVGCLAPYEADRPDWMAGMGVENREAFGAALSGEAALRTFLERVRPRFASITPEEVVARLGELVSDIDRAAITGDAADWLADVFRESVRSGIWGWHDDEIAFVTPWGFDVGEISVPVAIWQGMEDRMTPFEHGEWLAFRIPGAHAHLLPNHGHLSLGVDSFGMLLDDLLTITPA